MDTALLAAILCAELLRLFLVHKPLTKKAHFKDKFKSVERMIWDLEFKVFKTAEMREDVRKEYDTAKARLAAVTDTLSKGEPKEEKALAEYKRVEDQKVLIERDLKRFEAQMKALDLEVNGSRPTMEYPDGVQGITHQIDSLRELQIMLKDWENAL